MAEPKEGYNSGIQRVVSSGAIDSDGNYVAGEAAPVDIATQIGGEESTDSSVWNVDKVYQRGNLTIVEEASETTIGAGATNDTHLLKVVILLNAGPATATVAGFTQKTAAGVESVGSIVLTGMTDRDVEYNFDGILNDAAPLTVTPTVADTVLVKWRPA